MLLNKIKFETASLYIFFLFLISFIIGNFAINLSVIIALSWTIYCIIKKKIILNKLNLDLKILIIFFTFIISCSFFKSLDIKDFFLLKFLGLSFFGYFFKDYLYKNTNLIYFFLLILVGFLSIDIIFQYFYGKNLIGLEKFQAIIPSGFFGSVKIAGSYITKIIFILVSIFLCSKKKPFIFLLVLFLSTSAVLLSTERKSFFDLIIFFFLIPIIFPQKKTFLSLGAFLLFFSIFFSFNPNLKTSIFQKTFMQFGLMKTMTELNNKDTYCKIDISDDCYSFFGLNSESSITNNQYYAHYTTSIKIWKDYLFFGAGNKKFRIICSDKKYEIKDNSYSDMRCASHPHNIYLTILSEHGAIGFFIFILLILRIIFNLNNWKSNNSSKYFFPLFIILILPLPTGNIFSTWLGSFFWITIGFILRKNRK